MKLWFPKDLCAECKVVEGWPYDDLQSDTHTHAPSHTVTDRYNQVIAHLRTEIKQKEVDLFNITRTTQEAKELVPAYYKNMMQDFIQHRGVENLERENLRASFMAFWHRAAQQATLLRCPMPK